MPGIEYRKYICPNKKIVNHPSECNSTREFFPQDLAQLDLTFSTPFGVTYESTSGNVKVMIEGGPTLNTPWVVQNGKIVLSDPTAAGNWIEANTSSSQATPVDFEIEGMRIHAPGNSANQMVQITAIVKYNGTQIDSNSTTYTYYPPPPQASIQGEHIALCDWLITSQLSHPAYIFVIERQLIGGGAWSQSYSGQDTCVGRTGTLRYRGVYKDIFGNRGPVSAALTTFCSSDPPD